MLLKSAQEANSIQHVSPVRVMQESLLAKRGFNLFLGCRGLQPEH